MAFVGSSSVYSRTTVVLIMSKGADGQGMRAVGSDREN